MYQQHSFSENCPFSKSIFFGNYGILWWFFSLQVKMIKFLPIIANNEIFYLFINLYFLKIIFHPNQKKINFSLFLCFHFLQQSCYFFICQYFKKISFFLHSIHFNCFIKIIQRKEMENKIVSNQTSNNQNDYYFKMFIS